MLSVGQRQRFVKLVTGAILATDIDSDKHQQILQRFIAKVETGAYSRSSYQFIRPLTYPNRFSHPHELVLRK